MKILCIIPPYIPSYFNAGHHLPIFQVATYLRRQRPNDEVVAIDGAALNMSWRDIAELLVRRFDVIAILNDFDAIDTFPRMFAYIREFCPSARTVTFGRLSNQIPRFFERFGLDGIASAGDYEAAVDGFVEWVVTGSSPPPGVALLQGKHYGNPAPGLFLDASHWAFPDIIDIPYGAYDRLYQKDLNKFCGIPERRELVVPLARGCPVGCSYCDVPQMQGLRERRAEVAATLDYIEQSFARAPFEYVSFYAPTFTLKRRWVEEFCTEREKRSLEFPWKCVTTTFHLDEDLIATMARAGCVRVSIGLETLESAASGSLPKIKRNSLETFRKLAAASRENRVELNCFIIVGLPGDSVRGIVATIEEVMSQDCRVRPTVYTPYERLEAEMSVEDVARYNRQFFIDSAYTNAERTHLYSLLFGNEADRPTEVMGRIERRQALDAT